MNIGGVDYTQSVSTRLNIGNIQVPAGAGSFPVFTGIYGLDPKNPFFKLFAGQCGDAGGPMHNAFITQFLFTLAGSNAGQPINVMWGNSTIYNTNTSQGVISGLSVAVLDTSDNIVSHSQFAQICNSTAAFDGTDEGFCMRWTALADKVVITTSLIGSYADPTSNVEYFHGVQQQPF